MSSATSRLSGQEPDPAGGQRRQNGATSRTEILVPAQELREVLEGLLRAHGACSADVHAQALVWFEADLRGQPSHGAQRAPTMAARITRGMVNCDARPRYAWRAEAAMEVDGDDGFGPTVGFTAVDHLLARARTTGVAVAVVRRTSHLGMLAPYVEYAAQRGSVCLASSTSEALVHPWGGSRAMLGTNPLAVGIPGATDEPLVLDMSTASTSAGKVRYYARNGLRLPEGWAVDAAGSPTTDPNAAITGAISPFGGPKGYALGLTLGVLTSALAGTAYGPDVTGTLDAETPLTKGDLFLCIDPNVLGRAHLAAEVSGYLDLLRSSPRVDDAQPIRTPGDRARENRARRLADGIPITRDLWNQLAELAKGG